MKIKLNREQQRQLSQCVQIGGDKLADVVIHLAGLASPPLVPDLLLAHFKKFLAIEEAELLLSQLISISMLARTSESKSVEVVKALRSAIDDEEQQRQWDEVAATIQALIDTPAIRLVTKSTQLSYDYANLLTKVRILTDLRPLFDDEASRVEGGVVTLTLRLSFASEAGSQELSLAIDLQDVRKLQEQCERAMRKATHIRDEFATSTKKPCVISGESEYNDE